MLESRTKGTDVKIIIDTVIIIATGLRCSIRECLCGGGKESSFSTWGGNYCGRDGGRAWGIDTDKVLLDGGDSMHSVVGVGCILANVLSEGCLDGR